MANLKQKIGIVLIISVLIHILSYFPQAVEQGYSMPVYPVISWILRFLTGWIPFSIGDILYPLTGIWMIWKVIKSFKMDDRFSGFWWKRILGKGVFLVGVVYIIFNLFWGLNYNRKTVLEKMGLQQEQYSKGDLVALNDMLMHKVNVLRSSIVKNRIPFPDRNLMFKQVNEAYMDAEKKYPFLRCRIPAIKSSLWSKGVSYLGITGYYNPFTAEAQVNTNVPAMMQPYTTAHEIGHQVGFAREDEANFAGFLAAESSNNLWLKYSTFLDMFLYANRNLYDLDSVHAKLFSKQLNGDVLNDLAAYKKFRLEHESMIEPVFRYVYGKYLEQNQQPQGMLTYSDVIAGLIVYYKSKGTLMNYNGDD